MSVCSTFAQRPIISSAEPLAGYPLNTILIKGSGFSSNTNDLQVWFDQVKGTVVSSTDNFIEVNVPPQARLHNVEVLHLVSKLSSKSPLKFMPVFSGEGFATSKLAPPLSFTSAAAVFDICACDLTNDNKPELIGTKFENIATDLMVLHNQSTPGNLSFNKFDKSNLASLNINAPTGHVTCGDLNGDGKPEVVASRSGTTANSIFVLRNVSGATPDFAAPVELFLETGHFARQVSIHDLNDDGKPEIVVANSFNNVLYVFVNQSSGGTLTINPTPVKITMDGVPNSLALEIQDFNGDKKPDIVLLQNQGPSLYILRNQSAGSISFSTPSSITIPGAFNDINSADFNNDGKLDLVLTSVFNAQALLLLNQSTSSTFTFTTNNTLTTGTGPFGVDVSDINGDGYPDIIIPNRGTSTIDVFVHNRNASPGFSKTTITTAKTNWFTKVGDLDGDAKPDIAFTSFNNPTFDFSIEILRNKNCHDPKILNTLPLTICPGQTITLNAVAAPTVMFDWKNGGVSFKNTTDPFADITAGGTYNVTATSEGGACSLVSDAVVVSSGVGVAPATPVINPIPTVCGGSTLTITTSTVAGASYLWTGPAGFSATESDATLTIPNVSNAQSGQYTLRVKVGDCTSSADSEIGHVVDLASVAISNSAAGPLCTGQTASLSVNAATGHTYQWIRNGADIVGQTANTMTATQEGVYKVRVSFSGCSTETPDANVIILTKPVAGFNVKNAACIGEELEFTNTSTVDNRATVIYALQFDDGENSNSADATHTYDAVDVYSPSLSVSYAGITSCADDETKVISVGDASPPEITATVEEICAGDETMLSIEGAYTTITWSNNETTAFILITEPGTYSVATEDVNGCIGNDEIIIGQKAGCGDVLIEIPKMFSPNADTQNDRWVIGGIENYGECTMKIFDDKGVGIFQQTGYPVEGWDGLHKNGRPVPDGVYYFILVCPDKNPITGAITILR